MAAILEIGGHIEMIWTLKWHVNHQSYFLFAEIYHVSPKSSFEPTADLLRQGSITW